MSEPVILVLMPVFFSIALFRLRREKAVLWWLSFCLYAVTVGMFVAIHSAAWREAGGGLLVYLLPVAAMFLGLRPRIFERRRWLIPPVGIVLYLLGLAVSLSVSVSAGLLEP